MSDPTTCPVDVYERGGWHSHSCGKPVKRDGLCGIHASAKERVERNNAERRDRKATAEGIVGRLERHGVTGYVNYDGRAVISMSAAELADLLDGKADR